MAFGLVFLIPICWAFRVLSDDSVNPCLHHSTLSSENRSPHDCLPSDNNAHVMKIWILKSGTEFTISLEMTSTSHRNVQQTFVAAILCFHVDERSYSVEYQ
uniref:Uncharacterized protein LOC111123405 n=1 Tax=Crassostrea virginica TaxID=6565 RepID=A0A8B8CZU2_CRAVI|nr:uncharacterized protein LOC111123405 [Crassostrea virginica]